MAEIALQYNSSYNELLLSFANNVNTPDGAPTKRASAAASPASSTIMAAATVC